MGMFTPKPASDAKPSQARALSVVAHSVTGEEHLSGEHQGTGNQDAFGSREVRRGLIGVVSDGCGSAPDSKTGSGSMVRLALNACTELLDGTEPIPSPEDFCSKLEAALLAGIKAAAQPLAVDVAQMNGVLHDSYLATVWVVVVTADWTAILGAGDGYFALNDDLSEVAPRAGNEPEYLAYKLMVPIPAGMESVTLRVIRKIDTEALRSIMIGTDGLSPISRKVEGRIRIHDLWRNPEYLDQGKVREAMNTLAAPAVRLITRTRPGDESRAEVSAVRKKGLFDDDATLFASVRNVQIALPETWREYRTKFAPSLVAVPVAVPAPVQAPVPELVGAGTPRYPEPYMTAEEARQLDKLMAAERDPKASVSPLPPSSMVIYPEEEGWLMWTIKAPFRLLRGIWRYLRSRKGK